MTNNTILRYIAVGAMSFMIEMCVILIATHILSLGSVVAVGISFWVGLVASFILQRVLAFKDTSRSPRRLLKQAILYGILIVVNYIFTLWVVSSYSETVGPYLTRTVALLITTAWNFIIYSKLIFKVSRKN